MKLFVIKYVFNFSLERIEMELGEGQSERRQNGANLTPSSFTSACGRRGWETHGASKCGGTCLYYFSRHTIAPLLAEGEGRVKARRRAACMELSSEGEGRLGVCLK